MRIAHIILSRGFAGSERATAELCNAQSRTHDVLLIIRRGHANAAGITIRQWVDPGVRIVEVGNHQELKARGGLYAALHGMQFNA